MRKILIFIFSFLILQSCKIFKPYEQPTKEILQGLNFRNDYDQKDSTTVGAYNWRELFKDKYLVSYIGMALDSNLDVLTAMENLNIAEASLNQINVNTMPTLAINPNLSYQTNSLNTQFGSLFGTRRHIFQYGISFQTSWEIDVWGKLKSQRESIKAQYLGTLAAQQAVKSAIVANVATAYFQLLAYDSQKEIVDQTIAYRKEYWDVVLDLKEQGLQNEVAVKQAEAQYENVLARSVTLDYLIKVQENYINFFLNKSPGKIERSSLKTIVAKDNMPTGFPSQLLENRPDIRKAEFDLINAYNLKNYARSQYYPSFTISGSLGLQSIDVIKLFDPRSLFANLVAGLAQPLFNQRKIKTNYYISTANQKKAILALRKTLLQATQEVSNSLQSFEAQTKLVEIKQREYDAYELATTYSLELVNNGMGNNLDIIVANERALAAKLDLIQAKYEQLNAQVQLYRSLGGGWQ